MKQVANHLLETVKLCLPLLQVISDEEASLKPAPEKWSKKEIMGHLVDSACNNQMKFIRTMQQNEVVVPGYNQDYWVSSQHYNEKDWQQLITLWQTMNGHIAHIIYHAPVQSLEHRIHIQDSEAFTLKFIMQDYPEHMKHHLKAVLPHADFLASAFRMVY
jgi:hypothetical protein